MFVFGLIISHLNIDERNIYNLHKIRKYLLPIIATIIGVYLAIYLNNIEIQKEKKRETINLLNSGMINASNIKNVNQQVLKLMNDTLDVKKSYAPKEYPMVSPEIVTDIVKKDIVLELVSDIYLNNYYTVSFELQRAYNLVSSEKLSYREKIYYIKYYSAYLSRSYDLNNNEIRYLKKEIDYDSLYIYNSLSMDKWTKTLDKVVF